jgi:hypothetical protein
MNDPNAEPVERLDLMGDLPLVEIFGGMHEGGQARKIHK